MYSSEDPHRAAVHQIHAFSAGALGPGGIPVRADRRVDLSVHPPRVAGAAIGISSRFNPPAALSPQAEQLLKKKAARAAVITALLPADDRAVRRLPAVNEDLWNAQMHGNMDIGPDSDAEGTTAKNIICWRGDLRPKSPLFPSATLHCSSLSLFVSLPVVSNPGKYLRN